MDSHTLRCTDSSFGPYAGGDCRGGFDFTLLFEQSILWLAPSALLLTLSLPRFIQLYHQDIKSVPSTLQYLKLLGLLVLWASWLEWQNQASIPGAALAFINAFVILGLSYLEHSRSVRPSSLLIVYLLFSTPLDAVQARTLWLKEVSGALLAVFTAAIVIKAALLALEPQSKINLLVVPYLSWPLESVSGILSRSSFWWLNSLLWSGSQKILSNDIIYEPDLDLSSQLLETNLLFTWDRCDKKRNHSFLIAVFTCLMWPVLAAIPPRLCQTAFTFAQPFFIARVIDFVNDGDSPQSKNIGYGLIGATALIYLGLAFSVAIYKHKTYRLITMIRGALVSLIYAKTLKLDTGSLADAAAVTLISTDIDRIALGLGYAHEMWASLIDVGIAVYLLERQLGIVCIVPIIIALACTFGGIQIARHIGSRTKLWLEAVQKRVGVTSTVLGHIKAVKMMALTGLLSDDIQALRVVEVNLARYYLKLDAWINVFANAPTFLSPPFTFLLFAFVPVGNAAGLLTSARAFTAPSIISIMTSPLGLLLNAIPTFIACVACFDRIQDYLLLRDRRDDRLLDLCQHSDPYIASPYNSTSTNSLDIDLSSRTGITSLVSQTYSQESNYCAASIVDGSFSYGSNENPVLHNINLQLVQGSFVMLLGPIGSGKSTLLKALLNEVETIQGYVHLKTPSITYCSQQPWLTNTSLRENILAGSTYDESWYQEIVDACALQPDFASLVHGDMTSAGSKGAALSGGQKQRIAIARALYSRKRLIVMDDVLSGLDAATEELVFGRIFGPSGLVKKSGTAAFLATHAIRHVQVADSIVVLGQDGTIQQQGSYDHLKGVEGYIQSILFLRRAESNKGDGETSAVVKTSNASLPAVGEDATADLRRRTGDFQVYKYYFASVGTSYIMCFLALTIVYVFCFRFSQVWLELWVSASASKPGSRTNGIYGGVYVTFGLLALAFFFFAVAFMFQVVVPKSASQLHWILLTATMNAPYSFFTKTDVGMTLNRCSKDMALVDLDLPSHALETIFYVINGAGQVILIAIGARYIAAAIPAIIIAVYFVQKFYLRTSRQLRYLDLETKSPLYSNMLETYDGLSTIRAAGWETRFLEKNRKVLDDSQRPYYALYCIQRWLNVVLALLVAAVAVLLVTFAVELQGTATGSTIGVALLNVLNFNDTLAKLITSWRSLETSLGAIARVRDFGNKIQAQDHSVTTFEPKPQNWPSSGRIEFRHISAAYDIHSPPVLRDISLTIEPGMKVGICGRTGSGKSSLLLALFGMLQITSGSIYIDALETSGRPHETVCQALRVIPQDPFLLPGTVRFNLSLDGTFQDTVLVAALERVSLWSLLAARGGLDADAAMAPLSHGQQQLFCVARTLLQAPSSHILVLDEATSNLDRESERMVQELLRESFADRTVIAVTHHLDIIMDFDRIAVLDQGCLVEWDTPANLQQREGGVFRALWEQQQI
ncbi:hypothetical protein HYALB_00003136 [Hymenoscyphus albidus]|uniref:P-loop containing nucleoside triphosphate hydrolase protein n=1 Tax=Hymenoscyphus albidus TaxID=595503 RepID=A0A9N9PQT2_9HELO|nr:hypothetical protein HYALB_00003136 [Hymenoscyphus albidus]